MRVLVIQSGGVGHCLAAASAVQRHVPGAVLTALAKPSDAEAVTASGLFAAVRIRGAEADDLQWAVASGPYDLCVVPFDTRLGIYYWHVRMLPVRGRMARMASYGLSGRLRVWRPWPWLCMTVCACVGVRAIHRPAAAVWEVLRRRVDVALLLSCALAALAVRAVWRPQPRPQGGPRRVVVFIPSLGTGGAQRQLVTYLRHLDRSAWTPEVVTLEGTGSRFEADLEAIGVRIVRVPVRGDFLWTGILVRLIAHLRRHPADVLHGWMHLAAALTAIAGTMAGVPVLVGSYRSERPSRFPWFYGPWQRPLDLLTAPLHTALIANSVAVWTDNRAWARVPRKKFFVVFNGIDPMPPSETVDALARSLRQQAGWPSDALLIGQVGRLWHEKDHDTFIAAAARVCRGEPRAHVLIVGDGPCRDAIETRSRALGLDGRLRVLPDRRDAAEVIQALDVLVSTSTTEGFPNVLLEAAEAGTAAVTTDAGGSAEVVADGETGYVVPRGDADALADRILHLLQQPAIRQRFGAAARRRAARFFSAAAQARAIEAVYRFREDPGQAPLPRGPVRVAFVSYYGYGFLRPDSGLPVGGAEAQIGTLARRLSRDPRFAVTVVTPHASGPRTEWDGRLRVALTPYWGHVRVPDVAGAPRAPVPSPSRVSDAHAGSARRRSLDALGPAAMLIRAPIRLFYAVRRGLMALWMPVRERLRVRWHEALALVRWVRVFQAIDADVYVMRCASPQVGFMWRASRLLRRRFVYMVAHDFDLNGEYVRTQGALDRRFESVLRRADAVVCQHRGQLDALEKRYGRRGVLIRSLALTTPAAPAAEPVRKSILWVARLDPWKQPELLVKLAARMPDQTFVMVGGAGTTPSVEIEAVMAQCRRLPNVSCLGQVSFDEADRLFREALLFVNTSRLEGFPNTFLQAFVAGTPVISWDVDPDGVLERHGMGLCAHRDWQRFEDGVRALCADPALRRRMADAGRRYVAAEHDPERLAEAYGELFMELRVGTAAGASVQ